MRAVKGADLSLEVSGVVDTISFNSGDDVEQGALLLKLRADDDAAKLESLQATADLNQITYQRDLKQFQIQAVSQATLDTDAANLKNAKAQVAQQQAILDKKFLRAPFAGHLGIRAVDLGQYLGAGTVIVTLQALDPIFLDFFVPQQSVDQVRLGQTVTVRIDAFKDQTFPGEISAINPKVDASSRNVQVRATLKNADHKLLPGMYATVDISTGAPQQLHHAAADRDHLQSVRRHRLRRRQQGRAGRRQAATGRAPDLRHHRPHARRSGRRAQRRQ